MTASSRSVPMIATRKMQGEFQRQALPVVLFNPEHDGLPGPGAAGAH